ncbi:MAG: glycoside hydrolase family 92 protein, partial [Crocinitomicaceae bacterium]|nr:glycoside hydrolase family 92 protein [Crocinitomicaceae bacterium]
MKNSVFTIASCFILVLLISCNHNQNSHTEIKEPTVITNNFIRFVNPLIGTKNMGHTYPGATAPFGMVQLSPETNQQTMFIEGKYNPETYPYCSGYQYDDSTIFGFSHTHFSGTGHSDLGDFLIMPTNGKLSLDPGKATLRNSG